MGGKTDPNAEKKYTEVLEQSQKKCRDCTRTIVGMDVFLWAVCTECRKKKP